MTPCLFGAIADDYTGGSDLAGMLRERGVRTLQLFGLPRPDEIEAAAGKYEAVVLCLKSRSIDPADACAQSVEALGALRRLGARQIQFKYCSTFDSTSRGNIGPVTDVLLDALGSEFTIAVPALPVNGRTQYFGHLFVGSQLLSDSPLRHHPLNPMTDSNLVRHLQAQTQSRVGLIDWFAVQAGPDAIRARMEALRTEGVRIALVDAVTESDLDRIADAVADMPLITGGSGLGMALPKVWRTQGHAELDTAAAPGGTLILSGSCSAATLEQLRVLETAGHPAIPVNMRDVAGDFAAEACRLAEQAVGVLSEKGVAVVRSSAAATDRTDSSPGLPASIEQCFGQIARILAASGRITRLIVAGGETSGAVINALGIRAVEVMSPIDPGVPGLRTIHGPPLWLALKSGNFGAPDFFQKTMRYWDQKK